MDKTTTFKPCFPLPAKLFYFLSNQFSIFTGKGSLFTMTALIFISLVTTSFFTITPQSEEIAGSALDPLLVSSFQNLLADTTSAGASANAGEELAMYPDVQLFYLQNGFKPAFTQRKGLNGNGVQLLMLLERSREFGLEPAGYHLQAILDALSQLQSATTLTVRRVWRKKVELLLSDAAFRFMVNLHAGYQPFDSVITGSPWADSLPSILNGGIRQGNLTQAILGVQPRFIEYTALQQATRRFVDQTKLSDSLYEIPDPESDPEGFRNHARAVLVTLGFLKDTITDTAFTAALKDFQLHHGLEPDGKPGANTREAMKLSTRYRYCMLALNLDRLRKQSDPQGRVLWVNIPAYRLKVFDSNRLLDAYRVIVGKPKTPTPLLNSQVEWVITNPNWHVPASIAYRELIPKIKADSGYLKKNRFRLVDRNNHPVSTEHVDWSSLGNEGYSLRQDASSDNALGRVKFIFPNPYAVYLHDTPSRSLFASDHRALSHGCIRVQDPEKLAAYLVNVGRTDSLNVGSLISSGIHREITLSASIPIRICYLTCEAGEQGDLYFYSDIYGMDQADLAMLSPYLGI